MVDGGRSGSGGAAGAGLEGRGGPGLRPCGWREEEGKKNGEKIERENFDLDPSFQI